MARGGRDPRSVVGMTSPLNERNAEQVRRRIEKLVDMEHRLWTAAFDTGESSDRHDRLTAIGRELDRCWDTLRRRRTAPHGRLHPSGVPEPPNELDGPESEPPHLERGSPRPANQPGPEPDINPHAP